MLFGNAELSSTLEPAARTTGPAELTSEPQRRTRRTHPAMPLSSNDPLLLGANVALGRLIRPALSCPFLLTPFPRNQPVQFAEAPAIAAGEARGRSGEAALERQNCSSPG